MKKLLVPVLLIIFIIQGCTTNNQALYEWGSYEDLIYKSYAKSGTLPPEEQVIKLDAEYQIARSKNKALPPGFHAQLGILYFQLGNIDQANKSFITEKNLFPESKQFMDRLIAKIQKGRSL
jgi:hypothetical protein